MAKKATGLPDGVFEVQPNGLPVGVYEVQPNGLPVGVYEVQPGVIGGKDSPFKAWLRKSSRRTAATAGLSVRDMPAPPKLQLTVPLVRPSEGPQPVVPGNINLLTRPKVAMPDGGYATVRSINLSEDGKHILIPTVVNGKMVSNDEAIVHYHKTGEHMGIYGSDNEAVLAGQLIDASEAQRLVLKDAVERSPLLKSLYTNILSTFASLDAELKSYEAKGEVGKFVQRLVKLPEQIAQFGIGKAGAAYPCVLTNVLTSHVMGGFFNDPHPEDADAAKLLLQMQSMLDQSTKRSDLVAFEQFFKTFTFGIVNPAEPVLPGQKGVGELFNLAAMMVPGGQSAIFGKIAKYVGKGGSLVLKSMPWAEKLVVKVAATPMIGKLVVGSTKEIAKLHISNAIMGVLTPENILELARGADPATLISQRLATIAHPDVGVIVFGTVMGMLHESLPRLREKLQENLKSAGVDRVVTLEEAADAKEAGAKAIDDFNKTLLAGLAKQADEAAQAEKPSTAEVDKKTAETGFEVGQTPVQPQVGAAAPAPVEKPKSGLGFTKRTFGASGGWLTAEEKPASKILPKKATPKAAQPALRPDALDASKIPWKSTKTAKAKQAVAQLPKPTLTTYRVGQEKGMAGTYHGTNLADSSRGSKEVQLPREGEGVVSVSAPELKGDFAGYPMVDYFEKHATPTDRKLLKELLKGRENSPYLFRELLGALIAKRNGVKVIHFTSDKGVVSVDLRQHTETELLASAHKVAHEYGRPQEGKAPEKAPAAPAPAKKAPKGPVAPASPPVEAPSAETSPRAAARTAVIDTGDTHQESLKALRLLQAHEDELDMAGLDQLHAAEAEAARTGKALAEAKAAWKKYTGNKGRPVGTGGTTPAAAGTEAEIRKANPYRTTAWVRAEVAKVREAQLDAKADAVAGMEVTKAAPGEPVESMARSKEPSPEDVAQANADREHVYILHAAGDYDGIRKLVQDRAGEDPAAQQKWLEGMLGMTEAPAMSRDGRPVKKTLAQILATTTFVPEKDLSRAAKAIRVMARRFGVGVRFIENDPDAWGYHVAAGHVLMSHDAPAEGMAHTLLHEVFGHEWQARDPEGYKEFMDEVRRQAPQIVDAASRNYGDPLRLVTSILDEAGAETMPMILTNGSFLRGLARTAPQIWRRLHLAFHDFIRSTMRRLGLMTDVGLGTKAEVLEHLGEIAGPLMDRWQRRALEQTPLAWEAIENAELAAMPRPLPPGVDDELNRRNRLREQRGERWAAVGAARASKDPARIEAALTSYGELRAKQAASDARLDELGFGTTARSEYYAAQRAEAFRGRGRGTSKATTPSTYQREEAPGLSKAELLALAMKSATKLSLTNPEAVNTILATRGHEVEGGRAYPNPEQLLSDFRSFEMAAERDNQMLKAPADVREALAEAKSKSDHRRTALPSKVGQFLSKSENYLADVGDQGGVNFHRAFVEMALGVLGARSAGRSAKVGLKTILRSHGSSYRKFYNSRAMSDQVTAFMEGKLPNASPLIKDLGTYVKDFAKLKENDVSIARIRTAVDGVQDKGVKPANMPDDAYRRAQEIAASGGDIDAKLHAEFDGKGYGIIAKNWAPRTLWGQGGNSIITHDLSFASVKPGEGMHSRIADGVTETTGWQRGTIPRRMEVMERDIVNAKVIRPWLTYMDNALDMMRERVKVAIKDMPTEKANVAMKRFNDIVSNVRQWADEIRGRHAPSTGWGRLNAQIHGMFFTTRFATGVAGIRNFVEVLRNADTFTGSLVNPLNYRGWAGGKTYFERYVDQLPGLGDDISQLGQPLTNPFWRPLQLLAHSFGLGDWAARKIAFTVRGNRVLQAFDGWKPGSTKGPSIQDRMRSAGLDECIPAQRARFIEELHLHGVEAAASYAGDNHTAVVHGRYERWARSPGEQGQLGRVFGSVLEYPRGKVQQLATDVGKIARGTWPEKVTASGRIIGAYLTIGMTQMLVDRIRGQNEQQKEDDKGWWSLANPAKVLGELVWKPGGVATELWSQIGNWMDALVRVAEDGSDTPAWDKLTKSSTTLARDFAPYYQQLVTSINALPDRSNYEGIDVELIRKMRAAVDKSYTPRPSPKLQRDIVQTGQALIIGTNPGEQKWSVTEMGSKAQQLIRLAEKTAFEDGYSDPAARERDLLQMERLAGAFKRRGLSLEGDSLQYYLAAAAEENALKPAAPPNPYGGHGPELLQEWLQHKK